MVIPPDQAVSFDVAAFDDLVRNHGARLVHFRAMRCPVGMTDRYDARRPHDDHSGCSNGFIYARGGVITCSFLSNSKDTRLTDLGLLGDAVVQMTIPRFYDDNQEVEVDVAPFDRLYLEEEKLVVPHWQLVEANQSGTDKLSYPVESVTDIVDNKGHKYGVKDYAIVDHKIKWVGAAPGIDPESGKGRIYSIRYNYRPYWYVDRMIHQIRFCLVDNSVTGTRDMFRLPQAVLAKREFLYENQDNDPSSTDPDKSRQVPAPRDTLGSR
jgi:hypothetical protein